MKFFLLPTHEDLIEAIRIRIEDVARREGFRNDFSRFLVVFPGKRPSHFLRKALARSIGGCFVPPVILSMDGFVNYLWEKIEKRPAIDIEPIDAAAILYELHTKAQTRLGGQNFMSPDTFFPIGLMIFRDLEELKIEGVTADKVKGLDSLLEENLAKRSAGQLKSIVYFYEEFYRALEARGFSTRSSRYELVATKIEEVELEEFSLVILAGFIALTQMERILFRKLGSSDKVIFLFQYGTGIERTLSGLGLKVEDDRKERITYNKPETHFYQSPDTHGQIFSLAALLKEIFDRCHVDERNAIVLPSSETLLPLYHHALALFSPDKINISLGYPLERTPLFAFLNSLMELVLTMNEGRLYVPKYLNFVLHPYTKNIYWKGASEPTRIAFHTIEEELGATGGKIFVALGEIENNRPLLEKIAERIGWEKGSITAEEVREHIRTIHLNTIERFLSFENVRDFALKTIGLIDFIRRHSTASLHPLFHPFSEAFVQSLDAISNSLLKETSFSDLRSYFMLFKKYLATRYAPFEGTPLRGLQVLGILETRNLSFERLFFLDMNEDVIPGTRKDNTLVPNAVREMLGLPTYRDREKLFAYYFETLYRGAKEVHLFFVENAEREKSRFIERLLWEMQKEEGVVDPAGYVKQIQYRVSLVNRRPKDIRKTPEIVRFLESFHFSPSVVDAYFCCPLRFYYATVLGLGKKQEIKGEIERTDIGILVHEAFVRYFEKRKGKVLTEESMDPDEMDAILDGLFCQKYGKDLSGAIYLVRKQVRNHLREFLENYTIPLIRSKKVSIINLEHPVRARKGSFSLYGRLDQVERRDREIVVIDYKTGGRPDYLRINMKKLDLEKRESWNRAIGSLQLPFYILLYSEATGESIENMNGMYLFLGRSHIDDGIELPFFEVGEERKGKYKLLEKVIVSILEEIVSPDVPFYPTRDMKENCRICDFTHICGTQWVIG